ncbi:MAG: VWA domain-containing protein [Planctomycetaceae bacterium]|nr:VWA domain-containing protein [Planctomycetaceae bacterium]
MTVLMVFSIVLFLVTAAFSVDVAYMQLVRSELRVATDAAAKAAAAELSRSQSDADAIQEAIDVANANTVAGRPLAIQASDVQIGRADLQPDGSWEFTNGMPHTAVRVTALMSDANPTGSAPLFFGRLFGLRNFTPQRVSTASYFEQEVCLVIDRSHSMCFDLTGPAWSYPPGTPTSPDEIAYPPQDSGSRWETLEDAVDLFLTIVSGVNPAPRIALVTWASDMDNSTYEYSITGVTSPAVRYEVPLAGSTYSAISNALTYRGNNVMIGATNMSAGMEAGIDVLTGPDVRPNAQVTMVLMSDGQWNKGSNPVQTANDARKEGIIIHTVSFLDAADQQDMQKIATRTGGRHYHASNRDELIAAFEDLARILPATLTD